MRDLLMVLGALDDDEQLVEQVARARPRRVTVLLDGAPGGWGEADSVEAGALRDRLARLLAAVERRTGATVVGLAGAREQLDGWRFDGVVAAPERLAAPEPLAA